MRILGIDLAAQPTATGCALLAPSASGGWEVREPAGPADDDRLVALAAEADVLGVDAPLGWPTAFVEALVAHQGGGPWPGGVDRAPLTHRLTDTVVQAAGHRPLSVSSDRIGVAAMRGALLQHRWTTEVWGADVPRDGSGALVEVYPAAALRAWGVECKGYKSASDRTAAAKVRRGVVGVLEHALPWLDLQPVAARCVESDHVLDAVVCTLITVAQRSGQTAAPASTAQREAAAIEGWIHVPTGPLDELAPPG